MNEYLKVGAGCAGIRFPEEIFPIEGFKGIHDAPHVRLCVIDCGERIAIASMELVNAEEVLDDVRGIVSAVTGTKAENVRLHVTHAITTPHMPKDPKKLPAGMKLPPHMMDERGAEKAVLYREAVCAAAKEAAVQAAVLKDAKMGYGVGQSFVNSNRDVETPFGWWVGLAPDGLSNRGLHVLRFDGTDGKPVALLVNYGLKPCAIDNSEMETVGRLISSDVPGLACTLAEEKYGVPCLFFMSAAGDQVPREMTLLEEVQPDGSVKKNDMGVANGLKIVDRLGRELAEDIYKTADAVACEKSGVKILTGHTEIPVRLKGRTRMHPTRVSEFNYERDGKLGADVMTLGDIALVFAKPEINAVTELELQSRSPFAATLLFTMTDGGMKYMPDKSSYERLTWESQSAMLMEGSAEDWLDAAEKLLCEVHENV